MIEQTTAKILALNIEGHKHLPEIEEFASQKSFDVVELCEVFEENIPTLLKIFNSAHVLFAPAMYLQGHPSFDREGVMGVAILSNLPVVHSGYEYYVKHDKDIPVYDHRNPNSSNRVLLWADLQIGSELIRVAVTHFTWTPVNGEANDTQRRDLGELFKKLDVIDPDFLGGDFNLPSGGELHKLLTARYRDNVPEAITSTLDPNIHRTRGSVRLVVDHLFTKINGRIMVSGVEQIFGVSDHTGFTATLTPTA